MQNLHSTGLALDASSLPPLQRRNLQGWTDEDSRIEFQLLDLLRSSHLERRLGLAPSIAAVVADLRLRGGKAMTANLQNFTVRQAARLMNVSERMVYMAGELIGSGNTDIIRAAEEGRISFRRAQDRQTRKVQQKAGWGPCLADGVEQGRFGRAHGFPGDHKQGGQ